MVCNSYLVKYDDLVGSLEEVYLVRDEDARLAAQVPVDAALEQLPPDVGVYR